MEQHNNLSDRKYTMNKNNAINLNNPVPTVVEDHLTTFLRERAKEMLMVAIDQEASEFISSYADEKLNNGQQRVVRNGFLPTRCIQTGIGNIDVKVPRVRDRSPEAESHIRFCSNLVPKYMRRSASLDVFLPLLYLKGISTGEFQRTLSPLLGEKAKNLSPKVISGLKQGWYRDYEKWQQRSLAEKEYVYFWVDGIYLSARMESEKTCLLVIVGADKDGNKELIGMHDGFRESKASWLELLNDLKARGLKKAPHLAIGDGGLGFWGAIAEAYPSCQTQRCWVHKTANVLDKLPKSLQSKAKDNLHQIYLAETRKEADKAWDKFISTYQAKYPKAVNCLTKDKQELLQFYDFPAEHWRHIRTTNPIESTFSTVRHRTKKSRNCFSRQTILACVFKLMLEAEKRWRPLSGKKRIIQVINLEKFIDGVHHQEVKNKENNNISKIA